MKDTIDLAARRARTGFQKIQPARHPQGVHGARKIDVPVQPSLQR